MSPTTLALPVIADWSECSTRGTLLARKILISAFHLDLRPLNTLTSHYRVLSSCALYSIFLCWLIAFVSVYTTAVWIAH